MVEVFRYKYLLVENHLKLGFLENYGSLKVYFILICFLECFYEKYGSLSMLPTSFSLYYRTNSTASDRYQVLGSFQLLEIHVSYFVVLDFSHRMLAFDFYR